MKTFQHLATFTYPADLLVARSLLESMEIECNIKDEMTVQVHNFYSNALGGIKLEVPTEKYDVGKSLLMERGFEYYLLDYKPELLPTEEASGKFSLITALKKSIRFVVLGFIVLLIIAFGLLINI